MRRSTLVLRGLLLCSGVLLLPPSTRADFMSAPTEIPKSGLVIEKGKDGTRVIIQWTGQIPKKGGTPEKLSFTPEQSIIGGNPANFQVPPTSDSTSIPGHKNVPVKDYIQFSKDPGPVSVLMLEAFVPSGSDFIQYPFLDYIDSVVGPDVTIWVPDLYSSNDPGSDAVLYEAVNLSVYLADLPAFSLGDTFDIVNGAVADLPGMIFGNSEFTFDPTSPDGFNNPSPYSGTGYALSAHGNIVTPEPGSLILVVTMVMIALGLSRHRHSRDKTS